MKVIAFFVHLPAALRPDPKPDPTYIKIIPTQLWKANILMEVIAFFVHLPASDKLEAMFCPTYIKIIPTQLWKANILMTVITFSVYLPCCLIEVPMVEPTEFPTIT